MTQAMASSADDERRAGEAPPPARRIPLCFAKETRGGKPLGQDISALAVAGRTLFCASDETARLERLVYDPQRGVFADHESLGLETAFALPGGLEEMDIEGLAVEDGHLWITGSHSLKRHKPESDAKGLADLAETRWDRNRGFLGRLALEDRGDGIFAFAPEGGQMMKMGRSGRKGLYGLLRRSPLLAPFLQVPSKENGLDVEGIAPMGDRVVIGLRGPVLGTHALLVSLALRTSRKGHLKPVAEADALYRLHAVDLEGFGVRDLLVEGENLLILAGPTQAIEGMQRVYEIRGFSAEDELIPRERVRRRLALPMRDRCDHAEGMARLSVGGEALLLVAYDKPAPDRFDVDRGELTLDAFRLD